jgi:hypothetical protein
MFVSISSRMSNRDSEQLDHQPQFLIGPNLSSDPASLLDEARDRVRDEDQKNKESVKLARRLFIAMILIAFLGVVFYIVLPYYGLRLSPMVPIMSFIAILVGAIMTGIEEMKSESNTSKDGEWDDNQGCQSDGCATGMCPGPRPLQMFRDKKPPKNR